MSVLGTTGSCARCCASRWTGRLSGSCARRAATCRSTARRGRRQEVFWALATNPELACEVTLQPLARFPLDAAILFSDILMIPKAMGVGLTFAEGEGPRIERPLRSAADIDALPVPDPARDLRFVMDAVRAHPPRARR